MKKLKMKWSIESAEDLKAYHSIDAEKELEFLLFFELLKENQKHFGKEGLFKKYIKDLFLEFGARTLEEKDFDDINEITSQFLATRTIKKELNFPSYSNYKKQMILKRIKA